MGQATEIKKSSGDDSKERESKFLTFTLAGEEYGIKILKVKEIIGMMPITSVPKTPQFYKGVINLRGKVIPVVDLRLRFGIEEHEYTPKTCILVVEVDNGGANETVGVVVDSVSEVISLKMEDTEPPPDFGEMVETDYIDGMAKTDGGVKILLNIDKVLGAQQGSTECPESDGLFS